MKTHILLQAILAGCFALPLHAADIHITTPGPPEDKASIVIHGVGEGKPATYKATIWIQADQAVEQLIVTPSRLTSAAPDKRTIEINAIHVNSIKLAVKVPVELPVSIDATLQPGEFTGLLYLSTGKGEKLDPIPLTLHLDAKPNVITVPTPFAFKLTHCNFTFTCGFADWLLSREPDGSLRKWDLQSQTAADVSWTKGTLTLHGDKTGGFVENSNAPTGLVSNDTKPVWSPASLPISLLIDDKTRGKSPTTVMAAFKFDRGAIRPDHYQGQYRIDLDGADPIVVPFTLDVRDGPLLPLLVLFLGIVFGRFIQSTNAPQVQAQLRLLDAWNRASAEVDQVLQPPIQQTLRLHLTQIRVDIHYMSQPEADLNNQLDLVRRLASDALKLDLVEPQINALTDPVLKNSLLQLLAAARNAIIALNSATAEQNLATISASLQAGSFTAPAAPPNAFAPPAVTVPAAAQKPKGLANLLSVLSGAVPVSGEWMQRYGRPLLFLILLVLLAFVGLYNSYIRNATFGAEGFFDYLGLLLWGLSADVAQKTLQNLSLTRGS